MPVRRRRRANRSLPPSARRALPGRPPRSPRLMHGFRKAGFPARFRAIGFPRRAARPVQQLPRLCGSVRPRVRHPALGRMRRRVALRVPVVPFAARRDETPGFRSPLGERPSSDRCAWKPTAVRRGVPGRTSASSIVPARRRRGVGVLLPRGASGLRGSLLFRLLREIASRWPRSSS